MTSKPIKRKPERSKYFMRNERDKHNKFICGPYVVFHGDISFLYLLSVSILFRKKSNLERY